MVIKEGVYYSDISNMIILIENHCIYFTRAYANDSKVLSMYESVLYGHMGNYIYLGPL